MKISLDKNNADFSIKTYEVGNIQINKETYSQPIILTKDQILDWNVDSVDSLTDDDFQAVIDTDVDIIILGTGKKQIFPPPNILKLAAEKRLGLEVMDTAAASRTYNVLLSEDRSVCAAIFMIEPSE